jgi:hypothetical protein
MAANTYVALRNTTVATTTSSVTFDLTGITGYTDLVLVMNMQGVSGSGTGANTAYITFNGDTTSGLYSRTLLLGQSTVQSARESTQNRISLGNQYESSTLATIFGQMILNIQNYANTNVFKNVLSHYGSHADRVGLNMGVWRNTNAITTMTISSDSTNGIAVGSSFSLYGIKSVTAEVAPKATGGTIYSDSTYYYHAFGATGTFTPLSSLTADILVVAGGGGGGRIVAGGGGAGGLLAFTSQALTATGYTCTVGSGGAGSTSGSYTSGTVGGDSQFGALTLVKGGGAGGAISGAGGNGGSGGGGGGTGSGTTTAGGSPTSGQGNAGGTSTGNTITYIGAGGGGAGAAGGVNTTTKAGDGGVGSSTYSSWGFATGVGENVAGTYYLAGGGGGGWSSTPNQPSSIGLGGYGGGGYGGYSYSGTDVAGLAGKPNTGGGGGAAGNDVTGANVNSYGKNGGSGVIIIRYLKA